jgi:tRNA wybutosine-synthesizing protein 3
MSLSTARNGDTTPMVAVRSTGYSFDSIIGVQDDGGCNCSLVDENCFRTLVHIANDRFRINTERITRFRTALMASYRCQESSVGASTNPDWEDADARRRRKREEGLARQQAMQVNVSTEHGDAGSDEADIERTTGISQ